MVAYRLPQFLFVLLFTRCLSQDIDCSNPLYSAGIPMTCQMSGFAPQNAYGMFSSGGGTAIYRCPDEYDCINGICCPKAAARRCPIPPLGICDPYTDVSDECHDDSDCPYNRKCCVWTCARRCKDV